VSVENLLTHAQHELSGGSAGRLIVGLIACVVVERKRGRRVGVTRDRVKPATFGVSLAVGASLGLLGGLAASPSAAEHTVVTGADTDYYGLPVSGGEAWNGNLVYLGSPRHTDSGNRGECGWQENINGRYFGHNAATTNYYAGTLSSTNIWRNLNTRGYKVVLSANTGGVGADPSLWEDNQEASNSLGADVHIVSHTNAQALKGCPGTPGTASYVISAYNAAVPDSITMATKLAGRLGGFPDDGVGVRLGDRLNLLNGSGEIGIYTDAPFRAYVELFFHTNQTDVNWFGKAGGGVGGSGEAYNYGIAVDQAMGYPS